MWPTATPRITLTAAATTTFEAARAAVELRLRPGDEGGQPVDAAGIDSGHWLRLVLRLWLILRLRTMLALTVLTRLLLIALIGLALTLLITLTLAHIGLLLRLRRDKARLLAEIRKVLSILVAVVADDVFAARLLLVLAELLLRGRNQSEVVLGVLIVVFGSDRIARRTRVARKLQIFFGNMGCCAPDLDVGSIGFVDPCHRVLAAAPVIVIVPVAHTLLVLTVSHVLPLISSPESYTHDLPARLGSERDPDC